MALAIEDQFANIGAVGKHLMHPAARPLGSTVCIALLTQLAGDGLRAQVAVEIEIKNPFNLKTAVTRRLNG